MRAADRLEAPLLPREDPFFEPPAGFEAQPPGTVLRAREVRVALLGRVPLKVSAWQLLYRSSNLNRRPEATVTTVLLPACADPCQLRPVLAYQCAIDAVADRHFPSYALRLGADAPWCVPQFELLVLSNALSRGWAVSISDHEGLDGHFGAPREPGYRVLDGVRAAVSFEPLRLAADAPVALWGYSGGGMASAWAAEMAPTYAPELNIVGAALGSPVGDPGQALLRLNGRALAGLPAMVIAAIRHVYPELGRLIDQHATDTGRRRLEEIETLGTIAAIRRYRHDDVDNYIDVPLADLLATPEVATIIDDLRLGAGAPQCPLLVVQGVHDQFISVGDVDGLVQRYADAGAHVRYVRDRLSEHITLLPLSVPVTMAWLTDRFAGRQLGAPGVKTVWSIVASPKAFGGLLMTALVATKVAIGLSLTPRSWSAQTAVAQGHPASQSPMVDRLSS
ncbi:MULTISPECIES: lipase family protein [unclassified Mycobacterium]|uniref:lipase family protein n=1 Tax=unclassified Mycobacterium TaxID=2642494 RepID=UPI0029C9652A|nr:MULTISPECIES: lipase family protein [unclassified Mycobacterium]